MKTAATVVDGPRRLITYRKVHYKAGSIDGSPACQASLQSSGSGSQTRTHYKQNTRLMNMRIRFAAPMTSILAIAFPLALCPAAFAQTKVLPSIAGIVVHRPLKVLPPHHLTNGLTSINEYGGLNHLADEHSTIFPPGTLPGHDNDYLFFVASSTALQTHGGQVVLTGGTGPDPKTNQWTLDFAHDYDRLPLAPVDDNGQIFVAPFKGGCPQAQDKTFDLNYADAGSIIIDPTRPAADQFVMIYEGVNTCLPSSGNEQYFYATLGVATSQQYGKLWPSYSDVFLPLPGQHDAGVGPEAPAAGAFGGQVCAGDNCTNPIPPSTYGRYPIVSPPYSIADAVKDPLKYNVGEQAPSAFVDNVNGQTQPYVYVVHDFGCDHEIKECQTTRETDRSLTVARARLHGDTKLEFEPWQNSWWGNPGTAIGSLESPIFPKVSGAFATCQDPAQEQMLGSISYFAQTQQYVLTFLCRSKTDPANPSARPHQLLPPVPRGDLAPGGVAMFYSTLNARQFDLSYQNKWSTPAEITGSWHWLEPDLQKVRDPKAKKTWCIYRGWYPTFMSLNQPPGYLSTSGYIFTMDGCLDSSAGRSRYYSSWAFEISVNSVGPPPLSTKGIPSGKPKI
jgi:hypothetical protein